MANIYIISHKNSLVNWQNTLTPCPVQSAVQYQSACTLEIWPPRHEGVCTSSIHHTTA